MFFLSLCSQAQTISGKVVDAKTEEALPFANVFINNTTIGAVTDKNGYFTLLAYKEVDNYEVVFSFVGYETQKIKVTTTDNLYSLGTVLMKPAETELTTVEITSKRDKQWESDLKKFKKIFLGNDKQAAACMIINPWVIDFPKDEAGNRFLAKASAPIGIENNALGYRIIFYLTNFQYDSKGYAIAGNARFSELKSYDENERAAWEKNRVQSYRQSTHFFFKTIIDRRLQAEGFNVYKDATYISDAITRSANFYADLGKSVLPYDTTSLAVPGKQPGTFKISIRDRIEVHNAKIKATDRIYQDIFGSVSWISLRNNSIIVNENGFPHRPEEVIVSGDLSKGRIANMLPLNYRPKNTDEGTEDIKMSAYIEQVYVHTDKPYYYPGETIWFKGYMNYATPAWRDSLSSTVYVELIDRKRNIVMNKILPITNGSFYNQFSLPDSLNTGNYYLRAYTNFNRNFGDLNLYTRTIPVLRKQERIRPASTSTPSSAQSDEVLIRTDKETYKVRDAVKVTIEVGEGEGRTRTGNFSVSVMDERWVGAKDFGPTIEEGFPIRSDKELQLEKFPYDVERGILLFGKFLNEKGKPERATLSVLQLKSKQYFITESAADGRFMVEGLSFYEDASFSIQATDAKGKTYGKAEVLPVQTPPVSFIETEPVFETVQDYDRSFSTVDNDEMKGSKLLNPVVIESTKENEQASRPYGKPDYILKAKDINASYGNLLQTLPGKIPGLVVREVNNFGQGTKKVVYIERSGMTGSLKLPKEVIVMVNNARMNGTPEEILSSIDPGSVESIEVKTGVNVLFGADGGSGIVSIFTNEVEENGLAGKNVHVVKLSGYSIASEFEGPDYSEPSERTIDDRITLYWNPLVLTDNETGEATIQFYTSDFPGRYRIVLEGVLDNGQPIRLVDYIQVRD